MERIFRNSTHTKSKSYDCLISVIKGTRVKITYEAYNAVEKCYVEIFDGAKFNRILSMLDMGVTPFPTAYNIWDEKKRKSRADELFKIAETMCNGILN